MGDDVSDQTEEVKPVEPVDPVPPVVAPARDPWLFVLITLALCVAGWFLVSWMAETTRLQDCVRSGRKNCAPLDPATGR